MDRETYLDAADTLGLTTEFAWDVYLDLGDLPFEEARAVPGQLLHDRGPCSEQPGLRTVRAHDRARHAVRIVDQRVENLRVPILLVVFQIGAVTLAVLAGVGALALTRQAFELAVLHSRGFSRRTLLPRRACRRRSPRWWPTRLGLLLGLGLAKLAGRSNGVSSPACCSPSTSTPAPSCSACWRRPRGPLILLGALAPARLAHRVGGAAGAPRARTGRCSPACPWS